jgi:hypothetical protein
LIAIIVRLAKAVKITFPELFLVNDRRDDFSETGVAQGRCEVFRAPRNGGLFVPFFVALHALDT